ICGESCGKAVAEKLILLDRCSEGLKAEVTTTVLLGKVSLLFVLLLVCAEIGIAASKRNAEKNIFEVIGL
ncbi:MAG TPA: hypothetical protein DCL43_12730, partial [Chitinophagaceae bacterium]|nr:hypothetical protein [Chitinophagaceae bacterium]